MASRPEEVRAHVSDLKPREWAAVVPLIAMMVWMGVYSQILPAARRQDYRTVLEQSQVNVPFQVNCLRARFDAESQDADTLRSLPPRPRSQ